MPRFSFVSKIDLNPVDTQGVDAGVVDYNSAAAVTPLYQLTKSDWWCESLSFFGFNPLTYFFFPFKSTISTACELFQVVYIF